MRTGMDVQLLHRRICFMNILLSLFILIVLFINSSSCTDGDEKVGGFAESGGQENTVQGGTGQDKKDDVHVLMGQGDSAFMARNFEEAIALYTRAIAITPDMAELHYKLGLTYGHKMMLNEAIASFARAVSLDPNHAKAYNNSGLAYERKAMLKEAISQYEKAVSTSPDYAQAHYNLARCYSLRRGQYPEMRALAAEHYYRAGLLFLKQGDKQTAVMAYNYLKQLDAKDLEDALREQLPPESQPGDGTASP